MKALPFAEAPLRMVADWMRKGRRASPSTMGFTSPGMPLSSTRKNRVPGVKGTVEELLLAWGAATVVQGPSGLGAVWSSPPEFQSNFTSLPWKSGAESWVWPVSAGTGRVQASQAAKLRHARRNTERVGDAFMVGAMGPSSARLGFWGGTGIC